MWLNSDISSLSPACSPIGEVFRSRLRQFPSLITCCTIDWFSEWPDEALQSVARNFLQDLTEIEPDTVDGLVSYMYYYTIALYMCYVRTVGQVLNAWFNIYTMYLHVRRVPWYFYSSSRVLLQYMYVYT